jgi:hypothetical protein
VEHQQNQNLTLAIEAHILVEARKLALERGTTVNRLVREYLADLIDRERRRGAARDRLKAAFARGVVEMGRKTWTREDLHER